MRVSFTIPGEPVAKGRPRFTLTGQAYTPKRTANFETLVSLEYERQSRGLFFEKGVMIGLCIHAYMRIPASAPKKLRERMLQGTLKPTKRPDADNIAKAILDGLNGTAWHDDSQIVSLVVVKHYAEIPHTDVRVFSLKG